MKLFSVKEISEQISVSRITSGFGWRIHPITKQKQFHNGVDIALPVGVPLKAIADCAIQTNNHTTGGLQCIQIFEKDGLKIRVGYAHCSWTTNKVVAKKGEVIAKSGNTGASTAPHLHLTVAIWERDGWVFVDPFEVLEWDKVIV